MEKICYRVVMNNNKENLPDASSSKIDDAQFSQSSSHIVK